MIDDLEATKKAWEGSRLPLATRIDTACTIGLSLLSGAEAVSQEGQHLSVPQLWVEDLLKQTQVLNHSGARSPRVRSALSSINVLLEELTRIILAQGHGIATQLLDDLSRNSLLDRVENSVERVEAIESHVRDLAGPAATGSLADSYQERARAEERMSDGLRLVAVLIIFLAGTAVALLPFGSQFTLVDAVHRVAFSVPAVLLAAYLARESSQHRFVARSLRASELRFRALFPFADSLPEDERIAFLKKIGEIVFTTVEPQPGERDKGQGLPLDQLKPYYPVSLRSCEPSALDLK